MPWRRVVVVGLVLVAGCNGVSFGGGATEPTETLTPVPVDPTTASPTPSADVPPGVSLDGAVDVSELLTAHDAYLDRTGNSFTWVVRSERVVDDPNITDRSFTRTLKVSDGALLVDQFDARDGNVSLYASSASGYLRVSDPDETEYDVVEDPRPYDKYAFTGEIVEQFIDPERGSVQVVERGGQVYYRLHSSRPGQGMRAEEDPDSVTNYTATAYVTPEGFIRAMIVSYDRTDGALTRHTNLRFEYSAVGETMVRRPDWVNRAATSLGDDPWYTTGTATPPPTPGTPASTTHTSPPTPTRETP